MTPELGLCLKYYVDHFTDMEALYAHGHSAPKGVERSEWQMLRQVMLHATFQARAILSTSTKAIVAAAKRAGAATFPQNQRTTLDDNWVQRLGLGPGFRTGTTVLVGTAIEVPQDGEALLQHWVRCTPRAISREFSVWMGKRNLGGARIADRRRWRGEYLLVSELTMSKNLSAEQLRLWCSERAEAVFGGGWDELNRLSQIG